MDISRTDCALARESVSADLDGELQELDLRRLQSHLRVCADCSAWAEQVRVTTAQLRETALETPAAAVSALPRRGRTWRVGPALAVTPAAALVASVVIALSGQHSALGSRPTTSTSETSPAGQVLGNRGAVDRHVPAKTNSVFHAI